MLSCAKCAATQIPRPLVQVEGALSGAGWLAEGVRARDHLAQVWRQGFACIPGFQSADMMQIMQRSSLSIFNTLRGAAHDRMRDGACHRLDDVWPWCAGVHPGALLQRVLHLLAPSATIAVWCPFLQPLADAMQELQARPHVLDGRVWPHD